MPFCFCDKRNGAEQTPSRLPFAAADHESEAIHERVRKYMGRVSELRARDVEEKNDEERSILGRCHMRSQIPTRSQHTWYNSQIITNAYLSARNVFGARVLLVLLTLSLNRV